MSRGALFYVSIVIATCSIGDFAAGAEVEVVGNRAPNRWSSQGSDSPRTAAIGRADGRLVVKVKNGDTVLFRNEAGTHGVIFEKSKVEKAAGTWEVLEGDLTDVTPAGYPNFNAAIAQTTKPKAAGERVIRIKINALASGASSGILFACDDHSLGADPERQPMLGVITLDEAPIPGRIVDSIGGVNGSVFFDFGKGKEVFPIGFPVYLHEVGTGKNSVPVKTDKQGRYQLVAPGPGRYQVAWNSPDWGEGVSSKQIDITDRVKHLPDIAIKPPQGAVRGKVQMADGTTPYYTDNLGFEETAYVSVLDPQGRTVKGPVPTNADGEFAMAGIPQEGDLRIQAQVNGASSESSNITGSNANLVSYPQSILRINNRPPKIVNLGARQMKQVGANDTTLTFLCPTSFVDEDGDRLTYRWIQSKKNDDSLVPDEKDPSTARWTISKLPGAHYLHVIVSDNRGGHARAKMTVTVGNAGQPTIQAFEPVPNATGFLEQKGVGSADAAAKYYAVVDPNQLRGTLSEWWKTNGFDENDGSAMAAARTAFLNDNDLGFGRDMHMLIVQNGAQKGNVAAFVTNYFEKVAGTNQPDFQNELNADLAFKADRNLSAATVCMEYSLVEGDTSGKKVVKFFVYESGKPSAKRVDRADLDGGGDKFVPNLCLNCHGGDFNANSPRADLQSSFREFDLDTYKFPRFDAMNNSLPRNAPERLKATDGEQVIFKQMNDIVAASQPTDSIKQIIDLWYAGGGHVQNPLARPPGWDATAASPQLPDFYRQVVSKSCRTCHVALGQLGDDELSWVSYAQFLNYRSTIQNRICTLNKPMPHAKVTYGNFWKSSMPSQPELFRNFSAAGWMPFGACPP